MKIENVIKALQLLMDKNFEQIDSITVDSFWLYVRGNNYILNIPTETNKTGKFTLEITTKETVKEFYKR